MGEMEVKSRDNRPIQMSKTVFVFMVFSFPYVVSGGHVLVATVPAFSHINPIIPTLNVLADKYGHKSTLIVTEKLVSQLQLDNSSLDYVISENLSKFSLKQSVQNALRINLESNPLLIRDMVKGFTSTCTLLLEDQKLFRYLMKAKFDMVLISKTPVGMCSCILAYNLSIPFMSFGIIYDPVSDRIPFSPSFVPAFPFVPFTDRMTFFQRLFNSFVFLIRHLLPDFVSPSDAVEKYAPGKPLISTSELWRQVQFHLLDMDVLLDYPRPLMPNSVLVGGMGIRPARALTGELSDFMNSAENGVVVVSFGSQEFDLPSNIIDKFMKVFHIARDRKFVFKFGNSTKRETNLLILPWMPQNDLLGHPKTKAFITHCGSNGQYEALYHGVPMIGFPLFGDQFYNANRMKYKGYGIAMDVKKFEVDELVKNIKIVTEDGKYTKAIKLASKIFHSRPQSPKETAAYWIDHVMKYGGGYMRPTSLDLPFYQYIMLDVIFMVSITIFITCVMVIYLCKCCKKFVVRKQKVE